MANFHPDELNDFLSKIDDVNQKIKDLVDGKISPEEIDKEEFE